MNEMIEIARKSRYKNIVSLVTAGNIASEKLHERFGFIKKATFEDIGYKHNQWLAVSYYYLQLESDKEERYMRKIILAGCLFTSE